MSEIKLCECGCGLPTPIAKMTNNTYGWVKGRPKRFIQGHNNLRLLCEGQRFGRLVIAAFSHRDKWGAAMYRCMCDCENTTIVLGASLLSGATKSCGCLHKEVVAVIGLHNTIHGHDRVALRTPTYKSWNSMVRRCTDEENYAQGYAKYGAKGIKVCDRWNPKVGGSFENFLEDLGSRAEGQTLGRILDLGNYEIGNAFWMSQEEQTLAARNKRALLKWAA